MANRETGLGKPVSGPGYTAVEAGLAALIGYRLSVNDGESLRWLARELAKIREKAFAEGARSKAGT